MVDDVQLFGNQPHAATRFLRPMLMIGTFTSIGMTIADLIALEATADRDVSGCVMARGWLWLQAGLQALHSIVRVFLFLTISGAEFYSAEAADAMTNLALSRTWSINKRFGALGIAWFGVGCVVLGCMSGGAACGLSSLLLAHVGVFIGRCSISMVWFCSCFGGEWANLAHLDGVESVPFFTRRSAESFVSQLPSFAFGESDGEPAAEAAREPPSSSTSSSTPPSASPTPAPAAASPASASPAPQPPLVYDHPNCVVCLADFTQGERLVRLHCGHPFHADCLTQWLGVRKTCPLCQRWPPPPPPPPRSPPAARRLDGDDGALDFELVDHPRDGDAADGVPRRRL